MKKALILGAAAMAAIAVAPTSADAAEVKWGGYYRAQGVSGDMNVGENSQFNGGAPGGPSYAFYRHRLALTMSMIASEKTAAHMHFRPVDNLALEGAALGDNTAAQSTEVGDSGTGSGAWEIKRIWLETEAAGIGIKAGEMPLNLHKNIMYNDDGGSVGALILSKTFGGVTVLAGDVKLTEGTTTDHNQDADLYLASVLGKAGSISYNASLLYLDGQENNAQLTPTIVSSSTGDGGTVTTDTDNYWLAVTIGAKLGGIDLDVTRAFDAGYDNSELEDSGFLLATHLKGSTGFGGWNAYGWYSDENYSSPNIKPNWSQMHNSNSPDDGLMRTALTYDASGIAMSGLENTIGVGGQLTIKAGNFTIKPGIEYLAVNETQLTAPNAAAATKSDVDDMWGGWMAVSTSIDTGTTLSLTGAYVDVNANDVKANLSGGVDFDAIHSLTAEIKIVF